MEVEIKIPAVEQLLKMTASGIGAVAGPMLARWQARARADSLRIEAEGKADAIGLISSAQTQAHKTLESVPVGGRSEITIQEKKRQRNIESLSPWLEAPQTHSETKRFKAIKLITTGRPNSSRVCKVYRQNKCKSSGQKYWQVK